jgi:hypothetical protein
LTTLQKKGSNALGEITSFMVFSCFPQKDQYFKSPKTQSCSGTLSDTVKTFFYNYLLLDHEKIFIQGKTGMDLLDEQKDFMCTLRDNIETFWENQREHNTGLMEEILMVMSGINDKLTEKFGLETKRIQDLVGSVVSNGILSMKETLNKGIDRCGDNLLAVFGELGLVEQLHKGLNDIKSTYGDDRLMVIDQLNEIGGRLNQIIIEKLGNRVLRCKVFIINGLW